MIAANAGRQAAPAAPLGRLQPIDALPPAATGKFRPRARLASMLGAAIALWVLIGLAIWALFF